ARPHRWLVDADGRGRYQARRPAHHRGPGAVHAQSPAHGSVLMLIEMRGIERTYIMGDNEVRALRGVDLLVDKGDSVAIMGTSGSGKSTLMNIMGCLDQPTRG